MINSLSRATDISRAFSLIMGLTGPDDGVFAIGETLTPIVNLWELPEWAWARSAELAAGRGYEAAAGAGTYTRIELENPVGSNLLCVVEKMRCSTAAAVTVNSGASALTADSVWPRRDNRAQTYNQINIYSGSVGAAPGAQFFQCYANLTEELDFIIGPGGLVRWTAATANTALEVNFSGRVRPLMTGEVKV